MSQVGGGPKENPWNHRLPQDPPQETQNIENSQQPSEAQSASTSEQLHSQQEINQQIGHITEVRFPKELLDEELTAITELLLLQAASPKESQTPCLIYSIGRNGELYERSGQEMSFTSLKDVTSFFDQVLKIDQGPEKPNKTYVSQAFAQKHFNALKTLRNQVDEQNKPKHEIHILSDDSFKILFMSCVVAVQLGEIAKAEQEDTLTEKISTTQEKDPAKAVQSNAIIERQLHGLSKEGQEKEKLLIKYPLIRITVDFFKDWLANQAAIKKENAATQKERLIERKEEVREELKREIRKEGIKKEAVGKELGIPPNIAPLKELLKTERYRSS